jgi:hypothetical protein
LPIKVVAMLNEITDDGQVVKIITKDKTFYLTSRNKNLIDYEDSDAKESPECYIDSLGDDKYRRIPWV